MLSLDATIKRAREVIDAHTAATLTPAQAQARRMSLANFVKAAWSVLEPATKLVWGWHLDAITQHLQALHEGRLSTNNLAVAVPPGSGKSRVTSVMYPAWTAINQPSQRMIFSSGNPRVATRDSLLTRQLVSSPWYRHTFGISWDLSDDQDTKTLFGNTRGGWRMASTVGAKIIGDRADFLAIDDPLDASDAFSASAREEVIRWYSQAYASRLADMAHGKRLLISQRLHCGDLAGWLATNEPAAWDWLVIPQEWEESQRRVTSLGWTDPRKEDGELMFEARFPREVIEVEKVRLGRSGYAGQHQQQPFASGGEMFRADDLVLLDTPPLCSQTLISVDTAYKTGTENDWSVAVVLGQFEKGMIILDVVRGKWPYPRLKSTLIELAAAVNPMAVLIEDASSGVSLIQDLRDSTPLPLVPRKPDGDKISRASSVLPSWEAHRVHALKGAAWLPALMDELVSFPKGSHDDQVDALTQGLRYWLAAPGHGLLEYYKAELAGEASAKTAPPPPSQWSLPALTARVKSEGGVSSDLDLTPWHLP